MLFVYIVLALFTGIALGYLYQRSRNMGQEGATQQQMAEREHTIAELRTSLQHQVSLLEKTGNELIQANTRLMETTAAHSSAAKEIEMLKDLLEQQKKDIDKLKEEMQKDFRLMAQNILKEKSEEFEKQNHSQLDHILKPFKEKIEDFKKQFEENKNQQIKEQATLVQQIRNLTELNSLMREEANKLANALEGSKKTQGNWGEMILQKILEFSGLRRGHEYEMQEYVSTEEGERRYPDTVVYLPDNKHIIIDSKVTLNAYNSFVHSTNEGDANLHLTIFLRNIREHIKGLSEKKYHEKLPNSPDFVVMFMPIEGAFSLSLQNDSDIYQFAFDRKIILTSPTTLAAVLKTIANLWQIEKQNKNVMEIMRLGGTLHDKLVLFSDSYVAMGKQLQKLMSDYQENGARLIDGEGSAIKTALKMKTLGLKTGKEFNQQLKQRVHLTDENLLTEKDESTL